MVPPVIVVIDDDPDILDFMQLLLTEAQYRMTRWRTAAGAHALICREQPDLVILDLHLEYREAGWALLDRLCADARTTRIPTIMYSSAREFLRAHGEALRSRGCRAVVKPFAPDHLLTEIRAVLGQQHAA
jgi:DNA-binding response OmpR family regulator